MPRWADEGMAILADPAAKRKVLAEQLQAAISAKTTFQISELLPLDGYPQPERWGVFYGESASVVEYLVSRGTPRQFVQFLEAARVDGYDRALEKCYSIRDMQELGQVWSAKGDLPQMLAKEP